MKLGKLLVFSPYYPPHMGGLESHAQEFNENIRKFFKEIVVFTPNLPKQNKCLTKEKNIREIRFPAREIVSNFPIPEFWNKDFWRLWKIVNKDKYSLVISRTRFFLTSLMALFFAKKNKVKWIHIEHGSDYVKLSSWFTTCVARLYDEIIGKLIFKYSDYNVPISKAVDRFIDRFDKRQRRIISRGINFQEIDAIKADKRIMQVYKGYIKFVFCGRLYKWKGVERSIALIQSLAKEKSKIVFLIVGDGEDYESLKKYESKNIVFLGKKRRDEAISIMKCGDIYLHSSYPGGGLSTSLLEAMLCSCCPVATKNEGADEVVIHKKNGLILDFDKTKTLKKEVDKLLERRTYEVYGKKAKESVKSEFNWEKSIKNYLDIFEIIK